MDRFARILLRFARIIYPCKIYGKDNMVKGSAILICNHLHALDCLLVAYTSSKDTFFLAKEEIFKKKIVSKIITRLGGIPINREKADLKAIKKSVELLKDGNKLVIFPEGTRNKTGTTELQELKSGTAYISVKAKVPIIPLFISKKAKPFTRTKLIIGKPFDFADKFDAKLSSDDYTEMDKTVREKMIETQNELENILYKKKVKTKYDID